jgi:multicomponent K+:H+ antiporter subunit E
MSPMPPSLLRRLLPHPLLSLVLAVLWLMLQNTVAFGHVLLGSLLGFVIPMMTAQFWPDRPGIRSWPKLWAYLGLVFYDVVVANLQVARLILFRPPQSLSTRWVCVPLSLKTPEAISVLAGTISLTPGTVSADLSADGCFLLVHCLDAPDPEKTVFEMKQRYEARLLEILG